MPKSPPNKWSLKRIIKKASDVNFNTAVALSKSLKKLEKQNKKKSKELNQTPFHLMKNPIEVNKTLDERLSHSILQFSKINLINIVPSHSCKLWDKASLHSNTKPGDLSYDNINLTELIEYYVSDLMPYINPSTYREGDKMLNMSKIVGRERSFISQKNIESSNDQSINESVINDSFKIMEKNNSSRLSTNEIINDIFSLSSNSLPDTESDDDSKCGRFMKMFNNCKFSDFAVLLKSKDILYLHKFVLSAWMCNEELLKHSEHFILDIEDDVVLKLFKHLYSDGKFNVDDLIDTEEFASLCTMFGLKKSVIKRYSEVDIKQCINEISSIESNNLCEKEIENNSFTNIFSPILSKFPLSELSFEKDTLINKNRIRQCNSSVEQSNIYQISSNSTGFSIKNAQSTPNCRNLSIKNKDIDHCESISDKDLFESVEMDSNENIDLLLNDSLDQIHQSNDKSKELQSNYVLYKKLCSLTNDSCYYNTPDSYSKWMKANSITDVKLSPPLNKNESLKSFNENHTNILIGNNAATNDKMIGNNFENNCTDLECDHYSPTFCPRKQSNKLYEDNTSHGKISNQIQENIKIQNSFDKNNFIELFDNDIDFNLKIISKNENEVSKNKEIHKSNIYSYIHESTPISFSNVDINNKLENNISEEMENKNDNYENIENSILPLYQRIGINYPFKDNKEKPVVIDLSSEDDSKKDSLSKNEKSKKYKNIKSVNKEKAVVIDLLSDDNSKKNSLSKNEKSKRRISSDDNSKKDSLSKNEKSKRRISKNELTKNSVGSIPKKYNLKTSRKRNSKENLDVYSTPPKQKLVFNPFTPMPDYSSMPTPIIKKEISNFGFKENLTKNNSIKILQQVYLLKHQVDTNEDSSSRTTLESLNNSLNESSPSKSSESEDKLLNDNAELFLFLKKHYLKDILTYKPIDIKKVLTELKDIGINTTLKKLNDYFDDQCILCSNDENNGKNKKYNRPLKASKMIL